jgi:peptide/nickel transport system substrate-binding protein
MFLHSSEIGKNNWSRYSNPEMDALLEKGRITLKWEDRAAIYKRVAEIVQEDVPMVYIYKNAVGYALCNYVKGVRKGFSLRFAWHGGGAQYWWMDK